MTVKLRSNVNPTWSQIMPLDPAPFLELQKRMEGIARHRWIQFQGMKTIEVWANDGDDITEIARRHMPAYAAAARACPDCGFTSRIQGLPSAMADVALMLPGATLRPARALETLNLEVLEPASC